MTRTIMRKRQRRILGWTPVFHLIRKLDLPKSSFCIWRVRVYCCLLSSYLRLLYVYQVSCVYIMLKCVCLFLSITLFSMLSSFLNLYILICQSSLVDYCPLRTEDMTWECSSSISCIFQVNLSWLLMFYLRDLWFRFRNLIVNLNFVQNHLARFTRSWFLHGKSQIWRMECRFTWMLLRAFIMYVKVYQWPPFYFYFIFRLFDLFYNTHKFIEHISILR